MEILLWVIEISQFQNYIKPSLEKSGNYSVTEINFVKIPSSEIFEIDNTDETAIFSAKTIANKLYKKYIEDGSEYEINISGKMRDELSDSIGNLDHLLSDTSIDLDALYTVFEQSVQEMMTLQSISFERFKQSETFCDVKALLMNATTADIH